METVSAARIAPRRGLARFAAWLPLASVVAAAVFWWLVFYPGLLSNDSVHQYRQAVTGRYEDIRPPVQALVLRPILRLGGNIQHLMLAQCLAILAGVYALALAGLRFGLPSLPVAAARAAALGAVLLLLTPISPLPFYLMTFWTDQWVMAAFCWMGALWFDVMRPGYTAGRPATAARLLAFLALAVLMVLVRHNTIVLLPVVLAAFFFLLRRLLPLRYALPASLAPLALYAAAHAAIQSVVVVHYPMQEGVFAHELVGLCARYPHVVPALPHTAANLNPDVRRIYYPGYMNLYGDCLKAEFFARPDLIHADYRTALLSFPGSMLRVKFEDFRCHFLSGPCLKFHADVDANEFGLAASPRFQRLREWLRGYLWITFVSSRRGWVFVRHGVWLGANLLALGVLLPVCWRKGARRARTAALFLLVPLGYYASYFLASLACEFRYMYPSDLILQTLTLGGLLGLVLEAIRRVVVRVHARFAARPTPDAIAVRSRAA